jgi:putative FmdB family regulatory protein
MPIYEYRCDGCGYRTTLLIRSYQQASPPRCPRCSRPEMRKLISRVSVLRSEESRMEDLGDPSRLGSVDENDPKSVAEWARRMGKEMGEDMGGDIDEIADQIESGEMPDQGGFGDPGEMLPE